MSANVKNKLLDCSENNDTRADNFCQKSTFLEFHIKIFLNVQSNTMHLKMLMNKTHKLIKRNIQFHGLEIWQIKFLTKFPDSYKDLYFILLSLLKIDCFKAVAFQYPVFEFFS